MARLLLINAVAILLLLFSKSSQGAESILAGKVKTVDLAKHEFVLVETSGKERQIKLDENVVVNRGGRDGTTELKAKDAAMVHCDTSAVTWTATYILVQDGETANWSLDRGNIEKYDSESKQISYADEQGRSYRFSTMGAKLYINRVESKFESVKIGEPVLALLKKAGDQPTLKAMYITRK
jgi:hypothetical protein